MIINRVRLPAEPDNREIYRPCGAVTAMMPSSDARALVTGAVYIITSSYEASGGALLNRKELRQGPRPLYVVDPGGGRAEPPFATARPLTR